MLYHFRNPIETTANPFREKNHSKHSNFITNCKHNDVDLSVTLSLYYMLSFFTNLGTITVGESTRITSPQPLSKEGPSLTISQPHSTRSTNEQKGRRSVAFYFCNVLSFPQPWILFLFYSFCVSPRTSKEIKQDCQAGNA